MRLIDADALDFDVMGLTIVSPEVMNYANAVIAAIAKAPTIESEPVVRCKDCKYSKKFKITGNRHCDFHRHFGYLVSDDDYCSNGEKMVGGAK